MGNGGIATTGVLTALDGVVLRLRDGRASRPLLLLLYAEGNSSVRRCVEDDFERGRQTKGRRVDEGVNQRVEGTRGS